MEAELQKIRFYNGKENCAHKISKILNCFETAIHNILIKKELCGNFKKYNYIKLSLLYDNNNIFKLIIYNYLFTYETT